MGDDMPRPRRLTHSSRFEQLEWRRTLDARFVITELLADNASGLRDEDGQASDWLEIFNAGDQPGDLGGHFLSDDATNLQKWKLPSTRLDAGHYLVVFASGKDRKANDAPLHTNFRLDTDGGYLGLTHPDGRSILSSLKYQSQRGNTSFGFAMTDTKSEVPVAPINPSTLNAYVHLSADSGVTTTENVISQWIDQSKNNFVFRANHPKAPDNNPLLADGTNGLPAVHFDGSDLIDSDAKLQLFTSPASGLTTFAVIKPTVDRQQQSIVNHAPSGTDSSFELGIDPGQTQAPGSWGINRGGSNATSTAAGVIRPNAYQLMTTEVKSRGYDGDNVAFHRDGELQPSVAGNWTAAGGYQTNADPLAIGARITNITGNFNTPTPDSFFKGALAELVIFRNELSPQDRQGVEQYLSDRYNLGLHLTTTVSIDPQARLDRTAYFGEPTPGGMNSAPLDGFVTTPTFVGGSNLFHGRGYYDAAFRVNLSTATPGATLVYTTNGSTPTLDNGTVVVSPTPQQTPSVLIDIPTTTTLRAAAFKSGFVPSSTITESYLFVDGAGSNGVLHQPDAPPGFPTVGWGTPKPDYGVDPDVVTVRPYDIDFVEGLQQVPTISLVTDLDHLFGTSGIYANPSYHGEHWERPVSFEVIDPTTGQTLHENAGFRIHGGVGRGGTKLSMRLYFRDEYGAEQLNFPLIPEANVQQFDKLVLRAQWNDGFHHPDAVANYNANSTYIRDEFSRRTYGEMGYLTAKGNYAHVYLNGLYWGLYNVTERPDADFVAGHLGGSDVDYDMLSNDGSAVAQMISGDRTVWNQVMSLSARDLSMAANYQQITQLVDVVNLADYMLQYIYIGNEDGPGKHHHFYRLRQDDAKFRFIPWDTEWALGKRFSGARRINSDRVNDDASDSPTRLFQRLRSNADFRQMFADRVQMHMFGDGAMSPSSNIARFSKLMAFLEDPIVGESARWGDLANPKSRGNAITRDVDWDSENQWMLETFFPQRHDVVIGQLRRGSLFPSVPAPMVDRQGSIIAAGTEIRLQPGAAMPPVLETTAASPDWIEAAAHGKPSLRFDGRNDILYSSSPTSLFDTPSSGLTVLAVYAAQEGPVPRFIVNHGAAPGRKFELGYNLGSTAGDGSFGIHRGSNSATATPTGTVVANEYAIVTTAIHPTGAAPQNVSVFRNGTALPTTMVNAGWLSAGDYDTSKARITVGGRLDASTGAANGLHSGDISELIIFKRDLTGEERQSVEKYLSDKYSIGTLAGPSTLPNRISGLELWLSADTGVTIEASKVVRWRDQSENAYVLDSNRYTLPPARFGEGTYFTIDGSDPRGSDGQLSRTAMRYDGTPIRLDHSTTVIARTMTAGIWSARIEERYEVPPILTDQQRYLRISELHYRPFGNAPAEFIELTNISQGLESRALDLLGVTLTDGPKSPFAFTKPTMLAAGQSIVLVNDIEGFRVAFPTIDTGRIMGLFTGGFSNSGERIRLQDATGNAIVDFSYSPQGPWPIAADGTGSSLQLRDITRLGNDAASWIATTPSPGRFLQHVVEGDFNDDGQVTQRDINLLFVQMRSPQPSQGFDLTQDGTVDASDRDHLVLRILDTVYGDTNLDQLFDSSDLVRAFQQGQYEDDRALNSGWEEGDWNGDGEFTSSDLVLAFQSGAFQKNARRA